MHCAGYNSLRERYIQTKRCIYLAEDLPPFLPLMLASSSLTGLPPSPPEAASSAASFANLSSSSAFSSLYSFLKYTEKNFKIVSIFTCKLALHMYTAVVIFTYLFISFYFALIEKEDNCMLII